MSTFENNYFRLTKFLSHSRIKFNQHTEIGEYTLTEEDLNEFLAIAHEVFEMVPAEAATNQSANNRTNNNANNQDSMAVWEHELITSNLEATIKSLRQDLDEARTDYHTVQNKLNYQKAVVEARNKIIEDFNTLLFSTENLLKFINSENPNFDRPLISKRIRDLIHSGQKIPAIKELRNAIVPSPPLRNAKLAVEAYAAENGITKQDGTAF